MRLIFFICFILSYSIGVCSLTDSTESGEDVINKKPRLNHASFYVATDFLSLMNSVISKEVIVPSVTGEVCFNHTLGLLLNTTVSKEVSRYYNRTWYLVCPEIRWYKLNEDCSAMHLGIYCSLKKASISIDHRDTTASVFKYKESFFETGVSGGYKVLLKDHWVVNPAAYAGISNRVDVQVLDAVRTVNFYTKAEFVVRVVLLVGYRF